MSLELIKESVKINKVVGEESAQTIIENDIIVPDVKPDIARILLLDGDIHIIGAESMQDKVLINGVIRYKILYVCDDPNQYVKSINTGINFSYNLDILNAKQGMKCKVRCDMEHVGHTILNVRKINVKAIINVNVKIMDETQQDIANDLNGIEEMQVLKENIDINSYIGGDRVEFKINESMEIPDSKPAIKEILRNDIKITGKDHKITDNKIVVKGEFNVSTLYVSDDERQNIQFMEHEIPFTQVIDLPGIDEYAESDVEYGIADSQFEAAENSDGELRNLNAEITLAISAMGFRKRSIETLIDAYSPLMKINLEKEPFKIEDSVSENKSQVIIKDIIVIQDGSPDIAEVFNVLCKPCLSDYKIFDDKVTIEGIVNNNVLYLAGSADQPVFCRKQEIPFKHSVDIKGIKQDMSCEIGLDMEHCSYSMISSKEVEIRLVVNVFVKVVNQVMIPLISKAYECPLDDKKVKFQPSIIIYFAQPGDTLWKIAKRYLTTAADIKRVNNISDHDFINPGQQIIIYKRVI